MTWHGERARARGAERAEVHALGLERDRTRAAVPAHVVDQPSLIGGEAVGHLLGEPLDRAGREDVRRVPLDELADLSGAEGIAVDVERGRAGAVFERLFVTLEAAARVGAGDPDRRVVEPLAAAAHVGARHARVALAAADVGAAAVERVERGRKELVADLERFGEALAHRQGIQIGLLDVLADRSYGRSPRWRDR